MTAVVAILALVVVACGDVEKSQVAITQATQNTATTNAANAVTATTSTATETIATTTEPPSLDPATSLIGVWLPPGGGYLTFQEDDTWTWKMLKDLDPSDEGSYAFEDGVLTLTTNVGSQFCPNGEIGVYEVVLESKDEMAWTDVSDECTGRIDAIGETILRYTP